MDKDHSDLELELILTTNYEREGWDIKSRGITNPEMYLTSLKKNPYIRHARIINICKPIVVYLRKNKLGVENKFF